MSEDKRPRYCYLERGPKGYGFNLHGEAPEKPGAQPNSTRVFFHVIKSVDDDSPAQIGGLKQDDRLVGVNGFYVDQRPHNEVVELIKGGGMSCWLMVVDRPTDEHFYHNVKRKPKFSDAVYGHIDKRGQPVDINQIPMEEELVSEAENVAAELDLTDGAGAAGEGDDGSQSSEVKAEVEVSAEQEVKFEAEENGADNHSDEEEEPVPAARPVEVNGQPEVVVAAAAVAAPAPQPYTNHASPSNHVSEPSRPLFTDMQAARLAAKGQKHGAKSAGNWNNKWNDFNRL